MSVQSFLIEHDGAYVGHAMSLGTRYTFHTQDAQLTDLDEGCFETMAELEAAVAHAFAEPADTPSANS